MTNTVVFKCLYFDDIKNELVLVKNRGIIASYNNILEIVNPFH